MPSSSASRSPWNPWTFPELVEVEPDAGNGPVGQAGREPLEDRAAGIGVSWQVEQLVAREQQERDVARPAVAAEGEERPAREAIVREQPEAAGDHQGPGMVRSLREPRPAARRGLLVPQMARAHVRLRRRERRTAMRARPSSLIATGSPGSMRPGHRPVAGRMAELMDDDGLDARQGQRVIGGYVEQAQAAAVARIPRDRPECGRPNGLGPQHHGRAGRGEGPPLPRARVQQRGPIEDGAAVVRPRAGQARVAARRARRRMSRSAARTARPAASATRVPVAAPSAAWMSSAMVHPAKGASWGIRRAVTVPSPTDG